MASSGEAGFAVTFLLTLVPCTCLTCLVLGENRSALFAHRIQILFLKAFFACKTPHKGYLRVERLMYSMTERTNLRAGSSYLGKRCRTWRRSYLKQLPAES